MPTFSAIIPTLNEAASIERAVASAWRAGAMEVRVADGGSTDQTPQLASDAGALLVPAPRGRASQQNEAARLATGDFLLFLHADCYLADAASEQLAQAMADPSVQAGAFMQSIDAQGWLYRQLERGNAWRACQGTAYGDQAIFIRRSLFEQLGQFPQVPIMEDLLLMRKLHPYLPLRILPGPLHVSARRWQKQGVVRQTLRNWSLLTAHRCGVSLTWLSQWYAPHVSKSALAAGG